MTARNRTGVNPAHQKDISGANNPMYGKGLIGPANGMYGRYGALNPNWKGGRKTRKDGYSLIRAPKGHPQCGGYILEHRWVMEQHLGRYLEPEEVVHHLDENPRNNAIENLRLYASQAEHVRDGHGS